jgi:hypothetical protein
LLQTTVFFPSDITARAIEEHMYFFFSHAAKTTTVVGWPVALLPHAESIFKAAICHFLGGPTKSTYKM